MVNKKVDIEKILNISIPLSVVLAEKEMAVDQIMELAPGTIIEFKKSIDEYLDLEANNHKIACGEALKAGENFGIQIKEIGSIADTIKLLGKGNI